MTSFKLHVLLCAFLILGFNSSLSAQLVGGSSFLQGQYMEVGISPCGSYGTAFAPPAGYHPTEIGLGFVADVGLDGWATGSPPYCGDYFLPGNPVEGWGIEVGGITYTNGNNNTICSTFGIPGTNTTWSDAGGVLSNIWEGSIAAGIDVRQTTFFPEDALYIVTQVQLCNTTGSNLEEVYYFRSVDPDNDQTWPGGSFTTTNTIVANPPADASALVTATGPLGCFLGLGTLDLSARASYGLIVTMPTDASNVWAGVPPYNLSGTNIADENISLAFRIPSIPAGECVCLSFAYILNEEDLEVALNSTTGANVLADEEDITSTLSTTICEGESVDLSLVGALSDYTFNWSPATGLSSTTGQSVNASPSSTTTYNVTGSSADCLDIDLDITVVVDGFVNADAGDDLSLCEGESGQLMGSGGVSYSWSPSAGLSADNVPDPLVSVSSSTTYTLTVLTAAGCSATDEVLVTVSPAENVSLVATASICSSDSAFLQGAWQNTAGTYIDTLFASDCIDSVLTTVLNISSGGTFEENVSLCTGDSVFAGGAWQTEPGVYTDEFSSGTECDSVLITTVTGDDLGPDLNCPPDLSLSCIADLPDAYLSVSSFTAAGGFLSDNCGINIGSFKNLSSLSDGNSCPETITRVYQVADVSGNSVNCTQAIIVNDIIPPSISCPPGLNINFAPGEGGGIVNYTLPTATDNCGTPDIELSSGLGSGAFFPFGNYIEIWTATDGCGNSVSCNLEVRVDAGAVSACPVPTGLFADILSPTAAHLEWDAVPGAIRYHLKGRQAGTSAFGSTYPFVNSKNVGGLLPARTYEWQVRVLCADSTISPFSALNTFTMPLPKLALGNLEMQLLPNPASEIVEVRLMSDLIFKYIDVEMTTLAGQSVSRKSIHLPEGVNIFKLDLSGLNTGMYFINCFTGDDYVRDILMITK